MSWSWSQHVKICYSELNATNSSIEILVLKFFFCFLIEHLFLGNRKAKKDVDISSSPPALELSIFIYFERQGELDNWLNHSNQHHPLLIISGASLNFWNLETVKKAYSHFFQKPHRFWQKFQCFQTMTGYTVVFHPYIGKGFAPYPSLPSSSSLQFNLGRQKWFQGITLCRQK